MNTAPAFAAILAASFLVAATSASAAPRGPAFGNNKYRTEIRTARGDQDVDEFVASLVAGERLSVAVSAGKKSELRPEVTLVRPDGSTLSPTARSRKGGKSVVIKKLEVDASGPWTVRIAGRDGSEGEYTVSFKVKNAPPLRVKKQQLGGNSPLARTHAIPAIDGALLDLTVKWRGSDTPVELRALRDPGAKDVPGRSGPAVGDAVLKKTKAILKRATLIDGDGDYDLALGIPSGSARYGLVAKVRPTDRPSGRRVVQLSSDEPFLGARAAPVRGVEGRSVRITGAHFSEAEPPVVLFDGVPGTAVVVSAGGASLQVEPPAGAEGSTVSVAIVNPDGQAHERDDYFLYAPPPVLTDLVRRDGSPARGGSTIGGQAFRVQGDDLHPEQTVRFGANVATQSVGPAPSGELEVLSPAGSAGLVAVSISDPYGRSSTAAFQFEYKAPPAFDAQPYTPSYGAAFESFDVTATGTGFSTADSLLFDGEEVELTVIDAQTLRFTVPALPLGEYDVAVRDRVGTVVAAPKFVVKGPPVVTAVTTVDGTYAGDHEIPLLGGATVEVTGSSFHALDVVTLDGLVVDVSDRTFSSFRFETDAGAEGALDLVVTDAAGQKATVDDALRRVGYVDATADRVPTGTGVDDLSAWRGAVGDLDVDGDEDDVVIGSYGYAYDNVNRGNRIAGGNGTLNSPGTRGERTRVLFGDADGLLIDRTATHFPARFSDPDNRDDWNVHAVAIGDLDGGNGPEIVIGGVVADITAYNDVRIFRNDGSGTFSMETEDLLPSTYLPALYAYDETDEAHLVFTPRYVQGLPTSLAIGDLDKDGDDDIVVGRDWYDLTYEYVELDYVDTSVSPAYVYSGDAYNYVSYTYYYYPGTQIFLNGRVQDEAWADGSGELLPSAGDSNVTIVPGLHARDVALGDLDGDDDLDIVLTWDDPTTVSPYGLYGGTDQGRIATRVLLNDGNGDFRGPPATATGTGDVTSTWLPAASGNEFWQAHRLALVDLDLDQDLDLVLLHRASIDAYTGTTTYGSSALRILRNAGNRFDDVTSSALPALPTGSDDNWRGGALRVADVDGDGYPDILVGTREALMDQQGNRLRSTRLLLGGAGLVFRRGDGFLPPVSDDSGEADDLLIGDLAGAERPGLLILTEATPDTSPRGDHLRASDWVR